MLEQALGGVLTDAARPDDPSIAAALIYRWASWAQAADRACSMALTRAVAVALAASILGE